MPTKNPLNRAKIKARNAKIQSGIQKDLANQAQIQLAGGTYTPSSLAAVFQADSDAIDAADTARKALQQAVLNEKAAHARTAVVLSALHALLLALFGKQAVTILGDFGFNAPKSTSTKTVATKAAAVAKAKATRAARGTKGPLKKLEVKGNLDTSALEAAINDPLTSSIDQAPGNENAAPPASPPAAANPAPTPAAPKAGPTTGGNGGDGSTGGGNTPPAHS